MSGQGKRPYLPWPDSFPSRNPKAPSGVMRITMLEWRWLRPARGFARDSENFLRILSPTLAEDLVELLDQRVVFRPPLLGREDVNPADALAAEVPLHVLPRRQA